MMLFRLLPAWMLGALVLLVTTSAWADKPPRFVALLANGERIEGNSLTHWHSTGEMPRLEGRPLLEQGNMLRWQRDRWMAPGTLPKAYVEMHTGDRFPGTVVDFSPGNALPFETLPPHFHVRPEVDLVPPRKSRDAQIRILASYVKRIAWQRRDRNDYQPSTLFYRDGRSTQFRAIRFGDGFANILLTEGNRRVNFGEIAEIHLPAISPWQTYFDELAAQPLNSKEARIFQVETNDGMTLTCSTDRRQFRGDANKPETWAQGMQPAWSLDVIFVSGKDIWARRIWSPSEVPLSHITPVSMTTRSPLSLAGQTPQTNRNVQGGVLRNANKDYGWGFGVHGSTELVFDLPPGAKALRGRVGLDKITGRGGCVRARVFANNTSGAPLWESPYLVGSDAEADLGTIHFSPEQKRLILQIDAAHTGRPAGADPFDVRDSADWLDPIIELDSEVLKQEIAQRHLKQMAAWRDWTVIQPPGGHLQPYSYHSNLQDSVDNYRVTLSAREKPLILSREVKLGPNDNWLVVFANRYPSGGPAAKLEVRIGGEPVTEYEVPYRHQHAEDLPPLAVNLADYRAAGKPIQIEIRQSPTTHEGYVDWRAIQIVEQLPHLYRAFEDQGVFAAIDADQTGEAKLVTEDRHYGTHSVQVTPSGQFKLKFPQPIAIREKPKWGEYRFIRFAFRKIGEGRLGLEVNREGEFARPARYDAGPGEPVLKSAARVWNDKLPNHWVVMTRDLYAEFGTFDATGLTLTAPDGQHCLFDHVYFAKNMNDFNQIPHAPPPELVNQKARREVAKHVLDRGYPAVVVIETKDGRFGTGVVLTNAGEILTAGHVIAKANEECSIHLPDGKTVKAQTRGIYRDLDLGMIKITDPGEYRYVEGGNAHDLPEQQLYVGFAHKKTPGKDDKPAAHIVGIRRVFRGMIWTDFDLTDYSAGGPLLNRDGRLIGILAKRSEFGGGLFSRLDQVHEHFNRMRNGEVYGSWYPGLGPMFGVNVQSTNEGAKVLEVFDHSPAAKANLKSGDIVTKVDGRSVVSLEDIYAALGQKDPGQEAHVEYRRDGQPQQVKLQLVPRVP